MKILTRILKILMKILKRILKGPHEDLVRSLKILERFSPGLLAVNHTIFITIQKRLWSKGIETQIKIFN